MDQPLVSSRESHLHIEQIDGLVAAAGVDGALEILEAFRRSTSELLETLASQLQQNALEPAASTAHAVKGSAANVGAKRLADTASIIEEACKRGDAGEAETSLTDAREDFESFRTLFSEHLSKA